MRFVWNAAWPKRGGRASAGMRGQDHHPLLVRLPCTSRQGSRGWNTCIFSKVSLATPSSAAILSALRRIHELMGKAVGAPNSRYVSGEASPALR